MRLKKGRLRGHGGLHHRPQLRKARNMSILFDMTESVQNIGEVIQGNSLTFGGDCRQLSQKIDSMSQQERSLVKDMTVHLKFRIAQQQDIPCLVIIFVAGIVLLGLPWLLLFTDCWQKRYRTLFQTDDEQYQMVLECVDRLTEIKRLKLFVRDSSFGVNKLRQIESFRGRQMEYTIINQARAFNLYSDQINAIRQYVRHSQQNLEFLWGRHEFRAALLPTELEDSRLI